MKKTFIPLLTIIVLVLVFSSCKRRWDCTCVYTGLQDTSITRELRGYNRSEADRVCSSDEFASNDRTSIQCSVR